MTPNSAFRPPVRLALPRDADAIARLQQARWGEFDVAAAREQWQRAIERPPLATMRVLVAWSTERDEPVGFAVTGPSPDPDASGTDGLVAEITVPGEAPGDGHLDRLVHAAVDTLRADGFTTASCWLRADDDRLRSYLVETGWAPDGAHQEVGSPDGSVRVKLVRLVTRIATQT